MTTGTTGAPGRSEGLQVTVGSHVAPGVVLRFVGGRIGAPVVPPGAPPLRVSVSLSPSESVQTQVARHGLAADLRYLSKARRRTVAVFWSSRKGATVVLW